ncbi:MAG: WD domain protein [Thelocarpon impressellum]|nr:MAG: WD domain protein [Thelocarpon impressellum]
MSGPTSPTSTSTPADGVACRSPKRQRISSEHGDDHTPAYTTPDEHQSPGLEEVGGDDENERDEDKMEHTFYRDERGRRGPAQSQSPMDDHLDDHMDDHTDSPSPEHGEARPDYRPALILRGHKKGVSAVRFSPDGRWIASCSADATLKIWSASTGAHQQTLSGHLAGISTLAWSPDSKTLASGSDDKAIRLWDVPTGKPYPLPLLGHHNYIYAIAFSPKGNMLVSGSYDEAVFLWDVRTGRVMRSLPAHSDPVGGVDFVRDGTLVVSCAGDGLIRVWDTATGQCLRTLVHEDHVPTTSVRFAPNGRFVLAWTLDSSVRLWNYVDGRPVKTYQDAGYVNTRFSLGGAFGIYGAGEAFVASGSEDGGLVLWDVKSKAVLQRVEGAHQGVVLGVDSQIDPDTGRGVLVSCGIDSTVRIWRDGA